jgi:prevent-host-death family protein
MTWLKIVIARPLDDSSSSLHWASRDAGDSGSEAKTHLPQLLDDVERGETIVIAQHGRAIAGIVPEAHLKQAEVDTAIANIKALQQRTGRITVDEFVAAKHERHKY